MLIAAPPSRPLGVVEKYACLLFSDPYYLTPAPGESSTWRAPDIRATRCARSRGTLIRRPWTDRPRGAIFLSKLVLPALLEIPLAYKQIGRAGIETLIRLGDRQ